MNRVTPFFILFFAVAIQASLFKHFSFLGASCNLTLILLLLSVFEKSRHQRIMFGAFFFGLLSGGLSGLPFGSVALAMIASVFLFDQLLSLLPHSSLIHFFILVVIGTLIYNFVLALILSAMKLIGLSGFSSGLSWALAMGVAVEIVFNLAGALIIYPLRKWIIL